MKKYLTIIILSCTLYSFKYAQIFIIKTHGEVDYTTNTLSKKTGQSRLPLNWETAIIEKSFPNHTTMKTGANSTIILLLGEQFFVYLDQKSILTINFHIASQKYIYTCNLLQGRISIENNLPKAQAICYLISGKVRVRLDTGKLCEAYNPALSKRIYYQLSGSSTVFPPETTKRLEKPAFTFFKLNEVQSVRFKNFRFVVKDFVYIDKQKWRFAFPKQKLKEEGMLDIREKWH